MLKVHFERQEVPPVGSSQWYTYLYNEAPPEKLGYEYLKTMLWIC